MDAWQCHSVGTSYPVALHGGAPPHEETGMAIQQKLLTLSLEDGLQGRSDSRFLIYQDEQAAFEHELRLRQIPFRVTEVPPGLKLNAELGGPDFYAQQICWAIRTALSMK